MRSARLLLLTVLTAGCGSHQPTVSAPDIPAGRGNYVATTAEGVAVLEGQVEFVIADDSTVTGSWTISWKQGADTTLRVGPQVGSGTLRGRLRGDTLIVDLNPGYADDNVFLVGVLRSGHLDGTWQWDTVSGPRTQGGFSASLE